MKKEVFKMVKYFCTICGKYFPLKKMSGEILLSLDNKPLEPIHCEKCWKELNEIMKKTQEKTYLVTESLPPLFLKGKKAKK
jgi:DNA-directed RNA polymerase subunit RPC12/RpoP